ncbi:hypothetical protein Tco_0663420 [Tanacetum coccineum]
MQYCYACSRLRLVKQLKNGWIDSLQELSTLGTSLKRHLSKGIVHHPRLLNDLKISTTSCKKATNHYTKRGNGLSTMNCQLLDSQGPIPGMTPTQALTAIQTMADHSQKWHDGTLSRNISSNSNTDGLAAIVSQLDKLGHDTKKLKENVHAIQVGCQICKGPHLDKECPLNKEVKQVEEVKYGEFGRPTPFNKSNGAKFCIGPPRYYTRTDNQPPYGEKRPSLEELLNKHQEESARKNAKMEEWFKKLQENAEINTRNQSASLKNLETQIEQLTKELHSRTTNEAPSSSTRQCKVVNADHETPNIHISSSKLNNLHGVSFLSDSEYEGCQLNDFWGQSYAEWFKENSHDNKPRPRDYTFREWMMVKLGYTNVNESVKKALLKSWVIDCFEEALDPDKDLMEISFDDYKWVFDLEIEQLAC